jgi:hypothetical protein
VTTVDVPEAEFVINQATFYLTLLITIGSAGAIIANVIRGINNRVKANRLEAEAKVKAANDTLTRYVEDRMKEVDDVKARVDHMYWKLIDKWFDDQQMNGGGSTGHGKSN